MNDTYRVDLPAFQGPLDLLLSLVENEELEITEISLARVADQFLAYLERIEETRAESLADFLAVAAKLVLIKSRALLPQPVATAPNGEPDVADELLEQLRQYKLFKTVAGSLDERQTQGMRTYLRLAPPPKVTVQLDLQDVTIRDLLLAVQEALHVAPPAEPVSQVVSPVDITIKGQMEMIRLCALERRRVVFQEILAQARSRIEIAVTLLAILELLKQRQVTVSQEKLFGAIVIEPTSP